MKFSYRITALLITLVAVNTFAQDSLKINVGENDVEVLIQGNQLPAVVFESGLGNDLKVWQKVRDLISIFQKTISYSRSGYGKSGLGKFPRSPGQLIAELNTMLENSGVSPPYIFVGHSLGGFILRLFASMYPEKVAALVFVDASHEEQGIRYKEFDPKWYDEFIISAENRMSKQSPTIQSEFAEFRKFVTRQNPDLQNLPDVPVVILTNNKWEGDDFAKRRLRVWRDMHNEWAEQVSDVMHIVTPYSGHYIQLSEPELVVDGIKYVLRRLKMKENSSEEKK